MDFSFYQFATVFPRSPLPPVLEGIEDITIEAGLSFDPMQGVSAYDPTQDDDNVNGSSPTDLTSSISVSGDFDLNQLGTYTITYQVSSSYGLTTTKERVIIVVPKPLLPVIVGANDVTFDFGAFFNPLQGIFAYDPTRDADNSDGSTPSDLTSHISFTGHVDTQQAGVYVLVYTVTSPLGLSTTVQRAVTVNAATAPISPPPTTDERPIVKPIPTKSPNHKPPASSSESLTTSASSEIIDSSSENPLPSASSASGENSSSSENSQVPTSRAGSKTESWSLISAFIMIISVILAFFASRYFLMSFKQPERRNILQKAGAALIGVFSIFVFFSLNSFTATFCFVNFSTLLLAILLVIQLLLIVAYRGFTTNSD